MAVRKRSRSKSPLRRTKSATRIKTIPRARTPRRAANNLNLYFMPSLELARRNRKGGLRSMDLREERARLARRASIQPKVFEPKLKGGRRKRKSPSPTRAPSPPRAVSRGRGRGHLPARFKEENIPAPTVGSGRGRGRGKGVAAPPGRPVMTAAQMAGGRTGARNDCPICGQTFRLVQHHTEKFMCCTRCGCIPRAFQQAYVANVTGRQQVNNARANSPVGSPRSSRSSSGSRSRSPK